MGIFDWLIIAAFLGALIGIGFLFSKKNRNMEDYFLGGRSIPTWLVALAATGTSISAGTFVGSPELGFNTNLTFLMSCVGAVIGGTFVAALVLPKLYNARTITIYGYIGDRFGEKSKIATSVMFLIGQLFTSGSRLFIAAIAVSVMLFGSINFRFIVYSTIILGIISTIYTMSGGIKGLIYIDTFQILLVIGTGLVAVIMIYCSVSDIGLDEIWYTLKNGMVKIPAQPEYGMLDDGTLIGWEEGNKVKMADTNFSWRTPYNLVAALFAYGIFKFAQFSTDHEFVQRQLTAQSVKKASVSLIWSQVLAIPIVLIFLTIGLLLYVKYIKCPPAALEAGVFTDARDIFPQYICNNIPTGLRGLMVVGLLAAALSSFNSAINAMASSFVSDLYLPMRKYKGKSVNSDAGQIESSKKMAVLMGTVLTCFAIVTAVMQQYSGLNLVDFATGVMCFSYAGMLGVFMVALYTRRGNTGSVIAALVVGLLAVFIMQPYVLGPLSGVLFGRELFIAWPWWCPVGAVISFFVCLAGKPNNK